jgi:hypothetical protein
MNKINFGAVKTQREKFANVNAKATKYTCIVGSSKLTAGYWCPFWRHSA